MYHMTTCPYCGTALEEDSIFCMECGARVAPTPAGESPSTGIGSRTAPQRCEICGTAFEPDALFCTECGNSIGGGDASAPVSNPASAALPHFEPSTATVTTGAMMPPYPAANADATSRPAPATPHIFDGNKENPEAELEMKRHFQAPGNLG